MSLNILSFFSLTFLQVFFKVVNFCRKPLRFFCRFCLRCFFLDQSKVIHVTTNFCGTTIKLQALPRNHYSFFKTLHYNNVLETNCYNYLNICIKKGFNSKVICIRCGYSLNLPESVYDCWFLITINCI